MGHSKLFNLTLGLENGVPQGSMLGLLSFLLYVNELTNNREYNVALFAYETSFVIFR